MKWQHDETDEVVAKFPVDRARALLWACAVIFLQTYYPNAYSAEAIPEQRPGDGVPSSFFQCGEPVALAEMNSLKLTPDQARGPDEIMALISSSSKAKLARARMVLGKLEPEEAGLLAKFKLFPAPVVHRTYHQRLKSIFSAGKLLSPREAAKSGLDLMTYAKQRGVHYEKKISPSGIERPAYMRRQDLIEGGVDCVYASVGSNYGVRYRGEIVFRISEALIRDNAWISLESAVQFLDNYRRGTLTPSADDVLSYSQIVYAGEDLPDILGLALLSSLRKDGQKGRRMRAELAAVNDAGSFYDLLEKHSLVSPEAKIPREVPLDAVDEILVPNTYLADVLGWPESGRWKAKIKGY